MPFDRKIFFDSVRPSLFGGSLTQQQVDGMEAILTGWEELPELTDRRWLAYMLATTYHETSKTMWPIEEYGKGQGSSYGKPDPTTGQTYYGRGFVQLTWRENYARGTKELGLTGTDDLEWHASQALDLDIAADIMFRGMVEGWFRKSSDGKPQTLPRYFSNTKDDPYTAREIINGDKTKVPSWSGGVSIGNLIKGYHAKFLPALDMAWEEDHREPEPPVPPVDDNVVTLTISKPAGVRLDIVINGQQVVTPASLL